MPEIPCSAINCKRVQERIVKGFTPEELARIGGADSPRAKAVEAALRKIVINCCSLRGRPAR